MRLLFIFIFSLFTSIGLAHEGHFLAIENVKVVSHDGFRTIECDLVNEREVQLTDIKLDLLINGETLRWKKIKLFESTEAPIHIRFKVYEDQYDPTKDIYQIEIVKLFAIEGNYGGIDGPVPDGYGNRQKNELGTSSVIADAPWRMKKLDANGDIQGIPVHIFIHDADVAFAEININWIDIRIKNAGLTSFGAPLTYNSYLDAAYNALFTNASKNDIDLEIQQLSVNEFTKSATHTIDFNEKTPTFGGEDFSDYEEKFAYITFNIPPQDLVNFPSHVDIEVEISLRNKGDRIYRMRVFRYDGDLPKQKNYYRGDTHLHSIYTQNSAETGLPLGATKEAGQLIGVDWITTTDHTSDIDNYGTTITNNWKRILQDIQQQNASGGTLKYIPGQEVALNNTNGNLVHMLAYPSYRNPQNFPFLGDGKGDVSGTNVSVNSALNALTTFGGFSYAAHPFATSDKLPAVPVNGGVWNLNDASFPANGNNFPKTGGNIICNDMGQPTDVFSPEPNVYIKESLKGGQIWNERDALETGGDDRDPWDVTNANSGDEFEEADTSDVGVSYFKQFQQGQEVINHLNKRGLFWKNQNPNYRNWKMYYAAGSDAHGSFNSSNTNDFASFGTIKDNAVGKVSTLVYSNKGMGENGEHILEALEAGHSTISDGPIVTIDISIDGDINRSELLMGDDGIVNTNLFKYFTFNLNYTTTPEYGDVNSLTLIVGTENGEIAKQITPTALTGDHTMSYLLNELVDSIAGTGVIQEDKYFYIRAELNTLVTGLDPSVYRMDYSTHWSISNPIWLQYKNIPLPTEFDISAYPNPTTSDLNFRVKNPVPGQVTLEIYDRTGKLVFNTVEDFVENDIITISENDLRWSQGLYVIKAKHGDTEKLIKVVKE